MQSTWSRRGRGVVLVSAALLAACGDGATPSEPPGGDDRDPPGSTISVEERMGAIDAAETLLETLLASGAEGEELNTALAAGLEALPIIEVTGVDPVTSMAWARFNDGRLLIIGDNRPMGPVNDSILAAQAIQRDPTPTIRAGGIDAGAASGAQLSSAARANIAPADALSALPGSRDVRLLHSFGVDFDQLQRPIEDMGEWFEEHGYELRKGQEGDARVATLRNLSGDGFFYFNSHGGAGYNRNGDKLFVMTSSTLVTPANERLPEIAADLDHDRLVYFTARNGRHVAGIPVVDTRYSVTRFFVEEYWSFAENSIVFLNVCHSATADPGIDAFIAEMHEAGTGVYLGWAGTVTATGGFRAVRYFVDRLLGANEFQPESPKQRPFTWPLVLEDMASKGYTIDAEAQLIARPSTRSSPRAVLLRPSVYSLFVGTPEIGSDLYIQGYFGERPGRVTIKDGGNEVELQVKEWTPDGIQTSLPLTGAGSVGDVVVHVDEIASNTRRLHRYTGTVNYQLTEMGSLRKNGEMDVNVRLDPADRRQKPGEAPNRVVRWGGGGEPDAEFRFSGRGEYSRPAGNCTHINRFYGDGSVRTGVDGQHTYGHSLVMEDTGELVLWVGIAGSHRNEYSTICDGEHRIISDSFSAIGVDPELQSGDAGHMPLETTPQMHGLAGSRTSQVRSRIGNGSATARLWWTDIVPTPAYDPEQVR